MVRFYDYKYKKVKDLLYCIVSSEDASAVNLYNIIADHFEEDKVPWLLYQQMAQRI